MKKIILSFAILLFLGQVHAQKNQIKKNVDATKRPTVLQFNAGTTGFGLDIKKSISKNLALRLGYAAVSLNRNLDSSFFDEITSDNVAKVKSSNFHLKAELGHKWVRLVLGAAYFTQTTAEISVKPTATYKVNNETVGPDQIGNMNAKVDYSGIAPYVGLALFRANPKKVFNITLDLGTYYMPSPKVTIVGNGLLKASETIAPQLQENLKDWNWLPNIQLNLNFKL